MPKVTPKHLRPYTFHGVRLEWEEGREEAKADCPFCTREGKFSANVNTGLWRCLVCNEGSENGKVIRGGNAITFINRLWKLSNEATHDYGTLQKDRRILYPETLSMWGVAQSFICGDWLVPGYGPDGKIKTLYRYAKDYQSGKMRLLATSELGHHLFGVPLFNKKCRTVYLCEGPWDAMVLWEALRGTKKGDDGFVATSSESNSLLANASVLAVPGCSTFFESWAPLFNGKTVVLMFDSDHPKENNGKVVPPAGYEGMKRVAQMLSRHESPPKEIHHLFWGEGGHDPDVPSGYDVRDFLSEEETASGRSRQLEALLAKVQPIPAEWIGGRSAETTARGGVELESIDCDSWKKLILPWRKAMNWTEGLDYAFSIMLSAIVSTKAVGQDQLWVRVISPPSTGKSTLCEALSVNKRFVHANSTIRGFHSGYQSDRDGSKDNSLISKIRNKTLITKDGDTLLSSPNLSQILSEARDLYDKTTRSSYRNEMSRDHEGVFMTWILCGTASLRTLDSSELGERFLSCDIMEGIDGDMEREIAWRVANRTARGMSMEADGAKESQHDPDMLLAMQLTGGYVGYLRTNARELLSQVDISPDALHRCVDLGIFVSFMRARPSVKQDEIVDREFGARLVAQLTRLAISLAVVLNKTVVDEEVLRRVTKVALDTSRGRTLEIAKYLHRGGKLGQESKGIQLLTGEGVQKVQGLLKFLRRIGAVDIIDPSKEPGTSRAFRYRLSDRLTHLFDLIIPKE